MDFGWRESEGGLIPIFFEGPMASDFLQDRVCRAEANQFVRETVYAAEKIVLHKCLPLQ